MTSEDQLKALRKRYSHIVAWGRHHNLPLHKINREVLAANAEEVSPEVIYYDRGWKTVEDIQSQYLRDWIRQQAEILRNLI